MGRNDILNILSLNRYNCREIRHHYISILYLTTLNEVFNYSIGIDSVNNLSDGDMIILKPEDSPMMNELECKLIVNTISHIKLFRFYVRAYLKVSRGINKTYRNFKKDAKVIVIKKI